MLLTYAMIWSNWSRVTVRPGSGRAKAVSGARLTMTTPAAPAESGPEPSFGWPILADGRQMTIFPL